MRGREDNGRDKRIISLKYDTLAPIYEETYGEEQLKKYRVIASHLVDRERSICVELGCGTGLGLEGCKEIFEERWVGIDLSKGMLRKAKRRLAARERGDLVLGDSEFSPVRCRSADLVISVTLLSKTPNPTNTLKEMRRIVKPQGEVVVTVLKKEFSRKDIRALVLQSGLKIREDASHEEEKDHIFLCSLD